MYNFLCKGSSWNLLRIMGELKRIKLLFPLKSSENSRFCDDFSGNRSYLIYFNSLNIRSEIWRSLKEIRGSNFIVSILANETSLSHNARLQWWGKQLHFTKKWIKNINLKDEKNSCITKSRKGKINTITKQNFR